MFGYFRYLNRLARCEDALHDVRQDQREGAHERDLLHSDMADLRARINKLTAAEGGRKSRRGKLEEEPEDNGKVSDEDVNRLIAEGKFDGDLW